MGMYAPQQPPPQNSSYNNYNNSYFGAPNANFGIQATGIFGPQAQPPSNASMNQVKFVDTKQISHDCTADGELYSFHSFLRFNFSNRWPTMAIFSSINGIRVNRAVDILNNSPHHVSVFFLSSRE